MGRSAQSKAHYLMCAYILHCWFRSFFLRELVDNVICNKKVTFWDPYSESTWNKFVFEPIKMKIASNIGLVPWIKSKWKWTERMLLSFERPTDSLVTQLLTLYTEMYTDGICGDDVLFNADSHIQLPYYYESSSSLYKPQNCDSWIMWIFSNLAHALTSIFKNACLSFIINLR